MRGLKGARLIIEAEVGGGDARRTCARWLTWGTELRTADFADADLSDANLSRAELHGANLMRTRLQGAILFDVQLRGASLSGAALLDAILSRAKLHGAKLESAMLQGANLFEAQLHGADLRGASLHGAYIVQAELFRADLTGTMLDGADLTSAELHGAYIARAEFKDARGVESDQLAAALWRVDRSQDSPSNMPASIDVAGLTRHIARRWGAEDGRAHEGLNRDLWLWDGKSYNGDSAFERTFANILEQFPGYYLGPRLPGDIDEHGCEPNDGWTSKEIKIFAPEGWTADKHPKWDPAADPVDEQPFMQQGQKVPPEFMPTAAARANA